MDIVEGVAHAVALIAGLATVAWLCALLTSVALHGRGPGVYYRRALRANGALWPYALPGSLTIASLSAQDGGPIAMVVGVALVATWLAGRDYPHGAGRSRRP